jgi:hypothetical protein
MNQQFGIPAGRALAEPLADEPGPAFPEPAEPVVLEPEPTLPLADVLAPDLDLT